jgi:chloride channel 3/4/5
LVSKVCISFGIEHRVELGEFVELDLFTHQSVIWRAFVTSAIAAVSLQYVDPFGTSKLVLFQVQSNSVWRDFELVSLEQVSVLSHLNHLSDSMVTASCCGGKLFHIPGNMIA